MEDECTVTALRMIVKDLLVLTQAVNEGVINVLGETGYNRSNLAACVSLINKLNPTTGNTRTLF